MEFSQYPTFVTIGIGILLDLHRPGCSVLVTLSTSGVGGYGFNSQLNPSSHLLSTSC